MQYFACQSGDVQASSGRHGAAARRVLWSQHSDDTDKSLDSRCLQRLTRAAGQDHCGPKDDYLISLFRFLFCSGVRGSVTRQRTFHHHEISALSPCIPIDEPPPTELLRPDYSSSRATPDKRITAAQPLQSSVTKHAPTNRPPMHF